MTVNTQPARAARSLVAALAAITKAVERAERVAPDAAPRLADADHYGAYGMPAADAAAVVMDLRRRLANVERDLVTAVGKEAGKHVGYLSDGRQFKVERSADRKEWQHDDWQRDARRAVVGKMLRKARVDTVLTVVTEDGETRDFPLARWALETIGAVQAMHGSTAPRLRNLAEFGLHGSDYCTSTPSGWRLTVVPKPDTTTTTEEKPA